MFEFIESCLRHKSEMVSDSCSGCIVGLTQCLSSSRVVCVTRVRFYRVSVVVVL